MITVEIAGRDVKKYDAVMKELGLDAKTGAWAPGIQSPGADKTADGMMGVDVWDFEEDFVKFRDARLGPALGNFGGLPQPEISVMPLHDRWAR